MRGSTSDSLGFSSLGMSRQLEGLCSKQGAFKKAGLLRLVLLLVGMGVFFQLPTAQAENLRLTTFNIRFFGLGGQFEGTPEKEHRDETLKKFISDEVPRSDVLVFQEIVAPDRLEKNLLPRGWRCLTYDHPDETHQHVVLCHAPSFVFQREATDDNDVIDDVAIPNERARPAVTGILTDQKGRQLLRVVGVHLKSRPYESLTRIEQAKRMASYLRKVENPSLPVVILGDFNAFPQKQNGQNRSDVDLISEAFSAEGLDLKHVKHSQYTFRKKAQRSQLDHIWVSETINSKQAPVVTGVCNSKSTDQNRSKPSGARKGPDFSNPDFYYDNVSDHCPLTVEVRVQ